MSKKKISVVELNKKEEKIVLEEKQSPIIAFWHNHNFLLFLTALILSLTILSIGIVITLQNISKSEEGIIKEVSIDTSLDSYIASVIVDQNSITEQTAIDTFLKNDTFKKNGEVILIKTIDNARMTIKYYSDGSAIRIVKNINSITRVTPLPNGNYGISENGIINTNAKSSTITIKETKEYEWGTVTYYSDGSADISNAEVNLFVRNNKDITENYISDNRVSYLKKSSNIGGIKLNYYYDGTIEIIKNSKSYVVRNEEDIEISNNNVIFKKNNAALLTSSKKMQNGITIDYYQDGGAIIRDKGKSLSVRKSNSIIIKDKKIYEIIDNTYVEISNTKGKVIYYTNGSAVIDDGENIYYVKENSDIKYNNNNQISSLPDNKENITNETTFNDQNIKVFEHTAVITTNEYINIVPKEKIIYDNFGSLKEITPSIEENKKEFMIINNTNDKVTYRVVIERSPKTNLDSEYIRYQLSTNNNYVSPTKLNNNIWQNDSAYKAIQPNGTNYILLDGTIEAHDTERISIMFWTDYDTIPNSMQDKYFYGTIRVYAWTER